jgi:two-component system, cell cycle sensor histidine kinase and response regulator CckA
MERESVLDSAFDAVVTMKTDGTIVELNAAAARMFGYQRSRAIGRALSDMIERPDGDFAQLIGRRLELHAFGPHGIRFPVEVSVSRIQSAQGVLLTAWIRDLTEQRRVEEALRHSEAQFRQAQKMEAVGRLAGGVAHDFNNVLTAIFGYADLLLDSFDETDPRREDVEEIKRAADRAAGLTRQLLAFSRKQVMQPRRVKLNHVIDDIQTLLSKLLGDDIDLRIDLDRALGDVQADPGLLQQVLMNLAVNARDAMPDGGRLSIVTRNEDLQDREAAALAGILPGTFVTLTVADTGHGIPDHVRAHIFEPFFTTKEQGKGTGLGLATVYGIVKQSGGWIYLNETPGAGASFKIYLPRME